MKIVLNTNVLLISISDKSKHHWLYRALLDSAFDLYITNDILTEYEEKINEHWHPDVAKTVLRTLMELSNVHQTIIYYQLKLITSDPDDDKFANCAFAANCDYLVSNDKDFNVLKLIAFPIISVANLDEFEVILKNNWLNYDFKLRLKG